MARIFTTGFEPGTEKVFDVSQAASLVTSPVANGAYSLQHAGRPGNQATLKVAASTIFVRAHVRHDNGTNGIDFVAFKNSGGSTYEEQFGFCISAGKIGWVAQNRVLQDLGSLVIPINTWVLFEAKIVVSATVGTIDTKINGTPDLSLTGKNTNRQGGGVVDRISLDSDTGSMNCYSDDWGVNDNTGSFQNSWIGEGKVLVLPVSAAGDVTTLNNQVGSATHALNVDEVPPNDATDYNYDDATAGTNHYDLYNLTDPSNVGSVNSITTWIRAQKSDAGTGNFRFVHKIGSTEYRDAADIALSQSWAYYSQIRDVNPNTGVAWTAADLAALQAGFDAR